jgi:DNA-binding PadR family transcriptional regulator
MEILTETMFYVLMALNTGDKCGTDIAAFVSGRTKGRVTLGPATLYTILSKFESEQYIREVAVEGRKRTYTLTPEGAAAYREELDRLRACIADAEKGAAFEAAPHQALCPLPAH